MKYTQINNQTPQTGDNGNVIPMQRKQDMAASLRAKAKTAKKMGEEASAQADNKPAWKSLLEVDKKGNPYSTIENIVIILENDPKLAGRIKHDDFSNKEMVVGDLPWRDGGSQWADSDDANLRHYLEKYYKIRGMGKTSDAVQVVLTRRHFHPVREYLAGLKWDGMPRLETAIIDHIGAEDTKLNRSMTRNQFLAAVARVMQPGIKYDYCLVLAGKQGTGKTTFISTMGGEWYKAFNKKIGTKDCVISLSGAWIMEFGELSAMRKAEVEDVKFFLSDQKDSFRPVYGKWDIDILRQQTFWATTNEVNFLRGSNGNRRFNIVVIMPELKKWPNETDYEAIAHLQRERDQIWAEAYYLYNKFVEEGTLKYELELHGELKAQAEELQEKYNEMSGTSTDDEIDDFLKYKIPLSWESLSPSKKKQYYDGKDEYLEYKERTYAHSDEFLQAFKGMKFSNGGDYKKLAEHFNAYMKKREGWEYREKATITPCVRKSHVFIKLRPDECSNTPDSKELPF